MNEQAREAQRQYMKLWRERNRDKVKEHNRRYWEKKAQQMQQTGGETVAKADH